MLDTRRQRRLHAWLSRSGEPRERHCRQYASPCRAPRSSVPDLSRAATALEGVRRLDRAGFAGLRHRPNRRPIALRPKGRLGVLPTMEAFRLANRWRGAERAGLRGVWAPARRGRRGSPGARGNARPKAAPAWAARLRYLAEQVRKTSSFRRGRAEPYLVPTTDAGRGRGAALSLGFEKSGATLYHPEVRVWR